MRQSKPLRVEPVEPPRIPLAAIPDVQHHDDEPVPKLRDGEPITTENVRARDCHWIAGPPLGNSPMCGHPVVGSGPWCEYHYRRAYG